MSSASAAPPIFDFNNFSYTLVDTGTTLTIKQWSIKKPIDKTIEEVIAAIHKVPQGESVPKPLPPAIKQQVGICLDVRKKIRFLQDFAKQLETHLGSIVELTKKDVLKPHLLLLSTFYDPIHTTDELEALGKALVAQKENIVDTDLLLTGLRDKFFRALDGFIGLSDKDTAQMNRLICYAKLLGKEFMSLSFIDGKRTTVLLRSDVSVTLQKMRAFFASGKSITTYNDLVTVGTILTSIPPGFVEAEPYLKEKKALFLQKMKEITFAEDPRELEAMAFQLKSPYERCAKK